MAGGEATAPSSARGIDSGRGRAALSVSFSCVPMALAAHAFLRARDESRCGADAALPARGALLAGAPRSGRTAALCQIAVAAAATAAEEESSGDGEGAGGRAGAVWLVVRAGQEFDALAGAPPEGDAALERVLVKVSRQPACAPRADTALAANAVALPLLPSDIGCCAPCLCADVFPPTRFKSLWFMCMWPARTLRRGHGSFLPASKYVRSEEELREWAASVHLSEHPPPSAILVDDLGELHACAYGGGLVGANSAPGGGTGGSGRFADRALVRTLAALAAARDYASEDRARRGLAPCMLVVTDTCPPDAELPERLFIYNRWLGGTLLLRPLGAHRSLLSFIDEGSAAGAAAGAEAGVPARQGLEIGVLNLAEDHQHTGQQQQQQQPSPIQQHAVLAS